MSITLPDLGILRQPWREDALCAQTDPDLFFLDLEPGQTPAQARELCRQCPSKEPCLQFALDNDERHGVWGGTTHRQRVKLGYRRRPPVTPCGTEAGFKAHQRRGEDPCQACRDGNNEARRLRAAARRAS